jgi:flap endonuclease-1
MGIQDFYAVVGEHAPESMVKMKMSELRGVRVAVDVSIFLNKYVKSAGTERWLDSLTLLLCTLKKHGIKPVCIFDGPNPPVEKKAEQQRRRAEAAKAKAKIDRGLELCSILRDEYVGEDAKPLSETMINEVRAVMGRSQITVKWSDPYDVLTCLKVCLEKKQRQNLPILPIYAVRAKELIEIMGFSYFQAPGEAESLCAGMCCAGMVDAVLSEDTDVLAARAPFLLSKIDLQDETVVAVSYDEILRGLDFTADEFTDLCIMLSCDYNSRVSGYPPDGKKRKKPTPIGAKGAFLMVSEHRRLEVIEDHLTDPGPLNYRRCRELFTPPSIKDLQAVVPTGVVPCNGPVLKQRLEAFIIEHGLRIDANYIHAVYKPHAQLKFA